MQRTNRESALTGKEHTASHVDSTSLDVAPAINGEDFRPNTVMQEKFCLRPVSHWMRCALRSCSRDDTTPVDLQVEERDVSSRTDWIARAAWTCEAPWDSRSRDASGTAILFHLDSQNVFGPCGQTACSRTFLKCPSLPMFMGNLPAERETTQPVLFAPFLVF